MGSCKSLIPQFYAKPIPLTCLVRQQTRTTSAVPFDARRVEWKANNHSLYLVFLHNSVKQTPESGSRARWQKWQGRCHDSSATCYCYAHPGLTWIKSERWKKPVTQDAITFSFIWM